MTLLLFWHLVGTYLQAAASAADLQNPMIGFVDGFYLKIAVLVHPQCGFLRGAALPGAFFVPNTLLFRKHMIFKYVFMTFYQDRYNLLSNRGSINENCILDPVEC